MEVHGPNPKGSTTSCYYMIVEFEYPMSPKLIKYDAGNSFILPKMYDIVNQEATWDDDTGELVFNLQTERGIIKPSTTQRRRIPKKRIMPATGDYFSLLHCFPFLLDSFNGYV